MVFTNRRKWSSNNNDRDDQNQTTTTYKYNNIDINRFLLIGGENGENNESLNKMNSLWYALTLEPVAVQNERCSKLYSVTYHVLKFVHHIVILYIS